MAKRRITAEDLLRLQLVGDSQVSPDGKTVLFAKKHFGQKNDQVTNLFTVDVASREVRQWTQGTGGAGLGRWSPDGSRIAFVGGRDKPGAQLYTIDTRGGEAQKLTSLPEGSVGSVLWSPDGAWIAFTFRPTHPDRTEKAKKEREEKGLSTPPWEVDDLWYRMDGDGYFGPQRYALYVCDSRTGEHRQIAATDALGFYSYDWLRDSSGLVVCHGTSKRPLLDKPDSGLWVVPLKGKRQRIECPVKGSKDSVRVSPDGKTVAYLGSENQDDPWGVKNTRLWTVPLAGGVPKCLTAEVDVCLDVLVLSDTLMGHTADGGGSGQVQWSPDGKSIYVSVGHHGAVHVARVDAAKGGLEWLTSGHRLVMGSNLSTDGKTMAALVGDATHPMEVAVLRLGSKVEVQSLTDFNRPLLDELALSAPEEAWLPSTDAVKVHAWVMRPPSAPGVKQPSAKSPGPAVLEIHGGPHAQYGWAFFHEFQLLAAQGWTVVFSNPRGSKGYGEAFCAAIRGDWGDKDWDDVQAVTKWMAAMPEVDTRRMGVMGGSYGGYMTNWVVAHTREFKAAITDRCVFNWLSASGNSDFPLNRDGYFGGQPWGPIEGIGKLWQQSPVSHFHKVKTPMLIIHSEGDLRCHVEQSEQVFYVLQAMGVESRYVRYPVSTSHGLSRSGPPDLRLHRLGEIVKWWSRWFR
jgi:dipeptidyl aminopeptidase/acylaminoacyl peptidase